MNIIEVKKFDKKYIEQDYIICNQRGRNGLSFRFVPTGFDIETSTKYKKNDKDQVTEHYTNMYIGQFCIGENVLLFRTWDIFDDIIKAIYNHYCRLGSCFLFFIQNISFEFSFMAKELEYRGHKVEVFSRSRRHPMKVIIDDRIIILDSMKLTGMSLAKLAENFCQTRKLVGDLDYSLIRNKYTKLTEQELAYCINDVVILKEYAEYYYDNYLQYGKLPMTQTMIANYSMKNIIKELKAGDYVYNLMRKAYPKNRMQYDYINLFFSGAYTHANISMSFITIEDCLSFDMTSQYPYVCMSKYFPMSKFKPLHDLRKAEFYISKYCCLIDITFKNIETVYGITILSKHKLTECVDCIFDNGRLLKGKSCRAFITEVDLANLSKHYNFTYEINELSYAERGDLPDYFKLTIAELYATKSKLKGIPEKKAEYQVSKASLNGEAYGACCTRIMPLEHYYEDGNWLVRNNEFDFGSGWRSKDKLPQWAVYITSWARYMIGESIYRICQVDPRAYLYSDTDSNKVKNYEWIIEIFNEINNEIVKGNQNFIEKLNLRKRYPAIDFDTMGTFENEYPQGITRFKTLGAKKYIYEVDGEIETTVAGLPKGIFVKYCNRHKLEPFEAFELNNLFICDAESEKNCAYYMDEPKEFDVVDYQGHKEHVLAQSYVSIVPTSFSFRENREQYELHKAYLNLITNIRGKLL